MKKIIYSTERIGIGNTPVWNRLYVLVMLIGFCAASAQRPIFVGAVAGNKSGQAMVIFSRPFSQNSRFGFFGKNIIETYWQSPDGYTDRALYNVTFALNKYIRIGAGPNFVPHRAPRPLGSILFSKPFKSGVLSLMGTIETWQNGLYELFGFYEYSPKNTKVVNPYARLQFVSDWSNDGHQRSYQYLFAGLSIRKLRLGAIVQFNQYGNESKYFHRENYGGFVNYLIP